MSSGMSPLMGLAGMNGAQQMPGAAPSANTAFQMPAFDAQWYLQNNPDVAAAGVDPVTHFMQFGLKEGRAGDAAQAAAGRWTQLTKNAASQANQSSGQIPRLDPSDPASWEAFMSRGNAQVGSFNAQPRVKNLGMGTQG